jgi:hypothetical protein
LGGMNWRWKDFSFNDQRIIMDRFIVALQRRDVVGFSSCLNGFLEIKYNCTKDDSVKQAIFAGIIKHFGSNNTNPLAGTELANIIYYLGKSEIQWEEIRTDVQDSLFRGISQCYRSFNRPEISSIFQG